MSLLLLFGGAGTPTTQDIAVDDAGLLWSPYNTDSDGVGALQANGVKAGSTYAVWDSATGTLDTVVAVDAGDGDIALLLDTTSLQTLTPASCPELAVTIDSAEYDLYLTAYSASPVVLPIASGLSAGDHTVRVLLKSYGWDATTLADRKRALNRVKITGLRIDADATVTAPSLPAIHILGFGDSNAEGIDAFGLDSTNASNDVTLSWFWHVGEAFMARLGGNLYGGAGYTRGIGVQTASADYPSLYNTTDAFQFWNKHVSGTTRLFSGLFSPVPDIILIDMAGNDASLTAGTVTDALNAMRAAAGSSCWIFGVRPVANQAETALTNGFANVSDPSRTKLLTPSITGEIIPGTASIYSFDVTLPSQHLNYRGHSRRAAEVVQLMVDFMESVAGSGSGRRRRLLMVS